MDTIIADILTDTEVRGNTEVEGLLIEQAGIATPWAD